MRTVSSLPWDVQCIFLVRCGRLRATLRSLFPTVFLFSSVSQVTNNCKNNRYIVGDRKWFVWPAEIIWTSSTCTLRAESPSMVTWDQYDSILKWSLKVQNLFKIKLNTVKKSKAKIFRIFHDIDKRPKEISTAFAESSDAFVSFLSFYFFFSCWSGSSRVRSVFFHVIIINGRL